MAMGCCEIAKEKFEELKKFDTPTISNVVATYPGRDYCMGLYNPWEISWYTDETCRCLFPQLGSYVGYAVTAVYGMPDSFHKLSVVDVLRAVADSPKPAVLVAQQKLPDTYRIKNGLIGGNFTTALKAVGCVGFISNGPGRDISEVQEIGGFHLLLSGVTVGHGDQAVHAVNVPVSVCSMDVSLGEIVHIDEHGAVKFPATKVDEIIERAHRLVELEKTQMEQMRRAASPAEVISLWASKK
jgi:regulator of RNase E activity RraA